MAGTAIAALGIALGMLSIGWLDNRAKPVIVIEDPRPNAIIVVSVEGAVATPGVYHLAGDARVQDALTAAGGAAANADLARVNPAARLHDEERLVVPWNDAARDVTAIPGATVTVTVAAEPAVQTQININTASADLLETLPGIGPALAEAIVAYRDANGPFQTIDELAEVKGISLKMVDEIRSLITV
jgi:competence protein ComEA